MQAQVQPDKRAENYRNLMIERMKKRSIEKIANVHFTVGDTIMRNINLFRNFCDNPFYKEKNAFTLKNLHQCLKDNSS